ncbi:MAG TPA: GntR family transcriptional regulator [Methylomirabilota bacterium]|nr:GntR family transcriptional regulator [Methylomirabilota bacterium]
MKPALNLNLRVDARGPIPIRRQLTEQLKHLIEGGGVPREQALPSIRELAGFLGINPNTVARAIEDLKRSGYVESRRGSGVFVASAPPARPAPHLRERLLHDVVIRAAALGMTPDDIAVGVLSVAAIRSAVSPETLRILLIECSPPELEYFAGQLERQLPVRVVKVLLDDLPTVIRRAPDTGQWRAAVTSFGHLPAVERLLKSRGIPVIALLAEAHLETLHQLAQCRPGTRVGVVSGADETAHNLEHSIANAGLPNIVLAGACPAVGPALGRLVRRVDVMVCAASAAERVRALAGPAVQVIVDDRALDQRAIEMLADLLVRQDGAAAQPAAPAAARRPSPPEVDGSKRRRRMSRVSAR